MFAPIIRKATQVIGDPVLRRWLVGRALGQFPGEPSFTAHHPPYLQDRLPLAAERPTPPKEFRAGDFGPPATAIELPLPGLDLRLEPGDQDVLFNRSFADTETLLAAHRFAWIPVMGAAIDPAWVGAIWNAWRARHATPDDSWAWHPYTAAERAINILRFAHTHGLPGPADEAIEILARHAPAITDRLEYFGDHHTSNHLANNGLGLFLLGLWLGLPGTAELGGRILIEEAARIFRPSGMLREGSSHYHLLLAKKYTQVATEAEAHGRDEAPALRAVADRAAAAAAVLMLPGGLPLIGDISPDYPPEKLLEGLTAPTLKPVGDPVDDGWLRLDKGSWSGLWHVSPQGWRQMPGHGHEDCGGFELHYDGAPLFVDPGRGSYGESGDFDCSGPAHNTLLVDGEDPYPPNRPYYDDRFRRRVCGEGPELARTETGVRVAHHGYSRLRGAGAVVRQWSFGDRTLSISDAIDGDGTHAVSRLLVTPLAAELTGDSVILRSSNGDFRVTSPGIYPTLTPITRWTAYGRGEPATLIEFKTKTPLPWRGDIRVEKA